MAAAADWHSGLCGCFGDLGSCCMSYFCPCIQYGMNANKMNNGMCGDSTMMNALAWIGFGCFGFACVPTCLQRTATREKYSIPGGSVGDFLTSCCCTCCVLAQVAREGKAH
eukprot:TRINITY_DN988_c0_g1_i1.p3 TRINITY_DN988_c0_g1~~TRINITY_DN988_c0_g1_i1.p3  ORF type:complete len:111 (-),score=26.68 TRINITY_DN988_c0_g1_i1:65-397(-)